MPFRRVSIPFLELIDADPMLHRTRYDAKRGTVTDARNVISSVSDTMERSGTKENSGTKEHIGTKKCIIIIRLIYSIFKRHNPTVKIDYSIKRYD